MNSKYSYIRGSDLCKFYSRPVDVKTKPNDIILIESDSESDTPTTECQEDDVSVYFVSVATQTDYRESETQTDPWDPPFVIRKVFKDPEVLCLKELSYGNGLPASQIEIDYIIESRKNRELSVPSENLNTYEAFLKKKQLICNQVRNEWNYKISRHSERQLDKLKRMELALAEELYNQSERREKLLKNVWTQKKSHMVKMSSKLQKEIRKELKVLEKKSKSEVKRFDIKRNQADLTDKGLSHHPCKNKDSLNEEINYLLSKYYMNPNGLSRISDWLEKKKTQLYNDIPLAKPVQRNKREKLTEKAYQDLLVKKRIKMPPKIYHEDYDKEESAASSIKSEVEFEILELPEKGIDLVTVWQQVLRGRAYQKQFSLIVHQWMPL